MALNPGKFFIIQCSVWSTQLYETARVIDLPRSKRLRQSQLFICLSKKLLGTLCVAAELTIIRCLGLIDFMVSVDDILLRGTQVAMPFADVHDWNLHVNNAGLLNVFNNRV